MKHPITVKKTDSEKGGEPREEAAPASHTVEPESPAVERFRVSDSLGAGHYLRVRLGADALTREELHARHRIARQKLNMLVNMGAMIAV